MKQIKLLSLILALAVLLSACNAPAAVGPKTADTAQAPASTATSPAPAVTATSPAPAGKLITANGVSFTIPDGLATDATGSLVPEVLPPDGPEGPGANPAYINFAISGAQNIAPNTFFKPQIMVFDVHATKISRDVAALQKTLASPDAALGKDSVSSSMWNAAPIISANLKRLEFGSGKGVRRLTAYSQAIIPLDAKALFYEYQGLTADGKYLVMLTWPVNPAGLDGLTMPQDGTGYEAYVAQVGKILSDDEAAGKISPSLAVLDSLAQSIKVDSGQVMLPAPLPTLPAQVQPTAAPAAACDSAQFVNDVTVPDNTLFAPGTVFTKTWRLKNVGTCTWNGNYRVVVDSGPGMTQSPQYLLSVVAPGKSTVAPGQTVDISIPMQASSTAGVYKTYWMLQNEAGTVVPLAGGYNNRSFYVLIQVGDQNNAGATPTLVSGANGSITGTAVKIEQQQGSGAICAAKTSYFVYLDITTDGPLTAEYRIDATDDSGQVPDGTFTDSNSPEVKGSLNINEAGTQRVGLQLFGPYSYPDKVTIRVYLNGKNLPEVTVACK